MRKWSYSFILGVVLLGISSCGREKLTPTYNPLTVNQLKDDKPIFFSYKLDEQHIDEYAKHTGKFPIFGKLFQGIARVIANSSISNSGGHELDLAAVDVDLNVLSSIDFSLIDYISFDKLTVEIENPREKDSLAFVGKFEIWGKLDTPVEGLDVDSEGYSRLVYFDGTQDQIGCDGHCLNLNITPIDWKELLRTNKLVHLRPKLVINSVPLSTMKLAGSVNFSVKFNLGF